MRTSFWQFHRRIAEKIDHPDLKDSGQLFERAKARQNPSVLQLTDGFILFAEKLGKLSLGKSVTLSKSPNAPTNLFPNMHRHTLQSAAMRGV